MRYRPGPLVGRHPTRLDRRGTGWFPAMRAAGGALLAVVAAVAAPGPLAIPGRSHADTRGAGTGREAVSASVRDPSPRPASSAAPAPRPMAVASARLQRTIVHGLAVPMIAWRPDGRELACVEHMGHSIHLWDSRTGSPSGSMGEMDRQIAMLAYSPDGARLAAILAGDATAPAAPNLVVWDAGARTVLKRIAVPAAAPPQLAANLVYGSDGSYVAISIVPLRRTVLFDTTRATVKGELPTPANTGAMQLDPGGHVLAYASHDAQEGYPLKLVRVADGATVTGDARHAQVSRALTFDPSGRHVAVGDADGGVTVYDVRNGRTVRRLEGHDRDVFSVRFDPRGDRLLSASADGLRIWDAKTGAPLVHCRLGSAMHHVVAISPDGQRVATAGRDELKLWDTCPEATRPIR